jgi:hypothetical protein
MKFAESQKSGRSTAFLALTRVLEDFHRDLLTQMKDEDPYVVYQNLRTKQKQSTSYYFNIPR